MRMISNRNVRQYTYEDPSLIENYAEAMASEDLWVVHHRIEDLMIGNIDDFIRVGAYYDRPARELIFMKSSDHNSHHHKGQTCWCKGKAVPDDVRRKISLSSVGKKHSVETRRRMSENRRGANNSFYGKHHSEETIQKLKLKCGRKGLAHHNYGKPTPDDVRQKISQARKGQVWWTDGSRNIQSRECPGPEYTRGITRKSD